MVSKGGSCLNDRVGDDGGAHARGRCDARQDARDVVDVGVAVADEQDVERLRLCAVGCRRGIALGNGAVGCRLAIAVGNALRDAGLQKVWYRVSPFLVAAPEPERSAGERQTDGHGDRRKCSECSWPHRRHPLLLLLRSRSSIASSALWSSSAPEGVLPTFLTRIFPEARPCTAAARNSRGRSLAVDAVCVNPLRPPASGLIHKRPQRPPYNGCSRRTSPSLPAERSSRTPLRTGIPSSLRSRCSRPYG